MEMKQFGLGAIVLITLAAIVLSGIAVVTEYRDTLKTPTAVVNESFTTSSGTATLANDEITLSSFVMLNHSTVLVNGNVATDVNVNLTETGILTTSYGDAGYNATYTYAADSSASNTATQFITGLAIFGAFVGVLAISLIGKAIINLFKKGGF